MPAAHTSTDRQTDRHVSRNRAHTGREGTDREDTQ